MLFAGGISDASDNARHWNSNCPLFPSRSCSQSAPSATGLVFFPRSDRTTQKLSPSVLRPTVIGAPVLCFRPGTFVWLLPRGSPASSSGSPTPSRPDRQNRTMIVRCDPYSIVRNRLSVSWKPRKRTFHSLGKSRKVWNCCLRACMIKEYLIRNIYGGYM